MVMASFSVTSSRSVVIDYTSPYYHSGFAMLSIERERTDTNWLSFLSPFPVSVWVMIILIAVFTFISLAIFEWFSPTGMNPMHDKTKETFALGSAIKTVFSLICGNTISCKIPKSWPARWMQNIWGFFSMIYLAAYTANLTSSLADTTSLITVDGVYDPKMLDLRVAAQHNAASESYLKLISPQLYNHVRKEKIMSMDEGVEALKDDELDVLIGDTPVVDYIETRKNYDCAMKKLGTFAVDSYGVAFQRGQNKQLKGAVTSKFLEFHESGFMERLRKVYFSSSPFCIEHSTHEDTVKHELSDAAGVFVYLIFFSILCFLMMGMEHCVFKWGIPFAKRRPNNSWLKSKLILFLSQRAYRAILGEADEGASVFKVFAKRLMRHQNLLGATAKAKANSLKNAHKASFYDVVTEVYLRRRNRPLELSYPERDIDLPSIHHSHRKVCKSVRELALGTAGFFDVLRHEIEQEAKLNKSIHFKKEVAGTKTLEAPKASGVTMNGHLMRAEPMNSPGLTLADVTLHLHRKGTLKDMDSVPVSNSGSLDMPGEFSKKLNGAKPKSADEVIVKFYPSDEQVPSEPSCYETGSARSSNVSSPSVKLKQSSHIVLTTPHNSTISVTPPPYDQILEEIDRSHTNSPCINFPGDNISTASRSPNWALRKKDTASPFHHDTLQSVNMDSMKRQFRNSDHNHESQASLITCDSSASGMYQYSNPAYDCNI